MHEVLPTESYQIQLESWPQSGRHILAHFDESTIVVYQAFTVPTGQEAIRLGRFGNGFRLHRMSWIKTSFIWMMHRSNWGTADRQQAILAIRLKRAFFDSILEQTVSTEFEMSDRMTRNQWAIDRDNSDVLVQWDPDRFPTGEKSERRAIQLGLRGQLLRRYAADEIVEVIDMTNFAVEARSAPRLVEAGRVTNTTRMRL